MIRTVTILGLLAVTLAGCTTESPEVRFAAMQQSCQSYGFKPGTDAYGNCMMQKDISNQVHDDAQRARIGAGLRALSASMQPKPVVTCHTNASVFGGYNNSAYGNSTTTCQ